MLDILVFLEFNQYFASNYSRGSMFGIIFIEVWVQ